MATEASQTQADRTIRSRGFRTRRATSGSECTASWVANRGSPVLHGSDGQLLDECRRDFPTTERRFAEIVSPHAVDLVGERFAEAAWINRCHRRIQRAPIWPYNLYCTLHDQDLARLICRVDQEFFGTVRCPRRAALPCRARYSATEAN